ncbi:T9SS type A sorting domain-containing protein [candidate division KSB1 bacterium]|nr:T9SS type A sorting domain-containing protein [candidate division KSB1 bacterium]
MFGNTAWFCLRERAPWFLLLLGMIGAPLVLAADSKHLPLLNFSFGTTPRHFEVLLKSSTASSRFVNFSTPAFHADTVRGVGLAPAAVDREAAAGHALFYTFSISNLGNVDDEYTLATAGHRWPVTLLRADSAVKISKSEVVPAGKQFQFVIRIDVPGNVPIGASDTARVFVGSISAPAVNDVSSFITISLGPTGSLPWIEPFAVESRKQVPWRYQTRFPFNFGPVEVDDKAVNIPSSGFALHFDGDATGGDEVRSQPINLLGKNDAVLQFAFERGGAGNAPENGEDLSLDYFNADGEWINLLVLPGSGPVTTSFRMQSVILPHDAYHSSFRFRLRNIASVGPFDDWYIDDIRIFEVTRGRIPFIETFPLATLDADKWPIGAGVRVDTLGRDEPSAPFSANLQGSSLLQTQPLDLSRESAVAVRYYFQQGGFSDEPEAGDDLFVEFFDRSGAWRRLAQHLGVDGGLPNFTRQEAFLPPTAYHRDFRLRFRTDGDPGFDDWFIDDIAIEVFSPPEIEVTPTALAAKLFAGDSTTKELVISNAGPGELFFRLRVAPPIGATSNANGFAANIFSPPALKYPQNFYQHALQKNEPDWRAGQRVILGSGGPDNFGYVWRDSREAEGPAFQWTDISATGKLIPGLGDDDNVGPFRIGFAFPFYDSVFTSFQFCTNGFISFTGTAAPFTNDPLPSGGVANLVAPFWDDLDLAGGAAYYLSSENQLIVQWTNARSVSGNGLFTFQLILTPKGNIIFQYLRMEGATNFSTVGIQNSDGSEGLEIAFNTDFARDSLAVLIERPSSWLSFSPNNGRLAAGSATVQVKFNAAGLEPDSTYHTELQVESNDLDETLVLVPVAFEVVQRKDVPEHFNDFDTTNIKYVVNIDQATLNSQPLEIGDEIGVFTPGGLLAGAAIWNATGPARLIAYGDDSTTQKVEGFTRGQTMFFRVWDRAGNRDYPATPTYSRGDGRFGTGDSARISLLAAQTRFARRLNLSSGWSWISFNIMPDNLDVAQLMDSVANLAIMVNGDGGFFIPGQINGIGALDVRQGYKVYLNAPDSVKFIGDEVLPNTPIPLRQGWNFSAFLPMMPIAAEAALAGVSLQLALAKNDAGGFYIPNLINTLGSMQPGRGYRLYMNAADTLIYPFGARAQAKAASRSVTAVPLVPQHFKPPDKTGESYSLVILSASVNGKPLQAGDEIGVFTPAGKLAGAGVWPESGPLGIAVWRRDDDNAPTNNERHGFVPGEKMIFRAWRPGGFSASAAAEEIDVPAKFLRGSGAFDSEVFAIVELAANPLPQKYQLHQSFPNPLNGAVAQTVIRYELPQPGFAELRVYNLLGQVVRTLHQAALPAGFHEIVWDGRDEQGRLVAAGVYLYRLHVRSERKENVFTAVRKVVVVP